MKIRKSCSFVLKKFNLVLFTSLLAMSSVVVAQTNSWNLSRQMMTNITLNPTVPVAPDTGVWAFKENSTGQLNPPTSASYTLFPTYTAQCGATTPPGAFQCWHGFFTASFIGAASTTINASNNISIIQGMPILSPANNSQAVISWKAPAGVTGNVNIFGRIADIEPACNISDDGVQWKIRKTVGIGPAVMNVLPANNTFFSIKNPATALIPSERTFSITTVVIPGTEIYFIVDKNSNQSCDITSLDVLITRS